MIKLSVFAALLVAATGAHAAMYKCKVNGVTHFSDTPCADSAQRADGRIDNKPAISIGSKNTVEAVPFPVPEEEVIGGGSKTIKRQALNAPPAPELSEQCLNYFRPMLKDPRSVYINAAQLQTVENLERPEKPEWREVVLDARAKNSFGAYIPQRFHCVLGVGDTIDQEQSKVYKAYITLGIQHQ